MPKRRERDVINVNIPWTVCVGTTMHNHSVGLVYHADRWLALQAARRAYPGHSRLLVRPTFRD